MFEPEYVRERKKNPGIITNLAKSKADQRRREMLIETTIRAWYNVEPRRAEMIMKYLKDVTESEVNGGDYKNGQGYVSLRFPRDLIVSLRKVFQVHAPDLETYATTDDDIKFVCKRFPKLMPGGFKSRSRKD